MSNNTINERLYGLEILRFISGIAVLLWHYQHFFQIDGGEVFVRDSQPFYGALQIFYDYGFFGVQFFWCLSGYIFTWKYSDVIHNKKITAYNFFWLRFSRLYPLHLLTLFLVAAMQAIYFSNNSRYFVYQNNTLYEFFLQLTMLTGWGVGVGFNAPIWSVLVEIFAYVVFFLGLRFVGGRCWINILVIAIGLIALIIKVDSEIIKCLLFFYIGSLVCVIKNYFKNNYLEILISKYAITAVVFIPFLIFWFDIYKRPFFITMFLLTYMPLITYAFASKSIIPSWLNNLSELGGSVTYSIYLIHFPTQLLIVLFLQYFEVNLSFYSDIFFLSYISITFLLSFTSLFFFEKPMQKYIRKKTLNMKITYG